MTIKQKAVNIFLRFLKRFVELIAKDKASFVFAELVEYVTPTVTQVTSLGVLKFFCPGPLPEWRAQTLLTKEPETLEWIDGFSQEECLWDIGANVGLYSLYAAQRKVQVVAFEPSAANYYLLNKNIEINNMDDAIVAYSVALNDGVCLDYLHMSNSELGGALNSFGEAKDWQGRSYTPSFKQGMVGHTIDEFIAQFSPTFPNHIKIDVDGIEDLIIKGAAKTLKDSRLKSVLVELDTNQTEYIGNVLSVMTAAGFTLEKAEHADHFNDSEYSSVFNHIFIK